VFWVVLFVPLGLASVAVVTLFTIRLWRSVRQFGRTVADAGDRIAAASAALDRASAGRR
jgi:hypothetical protein